MEPYEVFFVTSSPANNKINGQAGHTTKNKNDIYGEPASKNLSRMRSSATTAAGRVSFFVSL